MNIFNIEKAFSDKARKNWDKLSVCIDLHDVIIEGKYNRYNVGANYCPNALRVLKNWTQRKDMVLILWSSSHIDSISLIHEKLMKDGVIFDYINENPMCPNTELCDFRKKFYFNILLDDKAGMDAPGGDWFLIENELKRIGEWRE